MRLLRWLEWNPLYAWTHSPRRVFNRWWTGACLVVAALAFAGVIR